MKCTVVKVTKDMWLGKVYRGLGGFVQLANLTRATLIVLGSESCADKDGAGVLSVKAGAQCEALCYPVLGVVIQCTIFLDHQDWLFRSVGLLSRSSV